MPSMTDCTLRRCGLPGHCMRMIAILIVSFAWGSSHPILVGTRWDIF